jgi:cell wall-associated NlpC family hydrolase
VIHQFQKRLIAYYMGSVLTLGLVLSCAPYPRYRGDGGLSEGKGRKAADKELEARQDQMTTVDIINLGRVIQSYLGTPYAGQGETLDGMDCSQFTREVFRDYNGSNLPRTAAEQYNIGAPVSKDELKYGDLIFFRTENDSVSHVGIYIEYGDFVHSTRSSGVIISTLEDKYWRKRYIGARRILAGAP